jgi:hypothetical protein
VAVNILNEFDFDCHECDEILKKERGCYEKGIIGFRVNNKREFRCPKKLITPKSWEYLRAYALYEKGLLPNGKGWMEESEKFLDAMAVIGNQKNKIEMEQMKKK